MMQSGVIATFAGLLNSMPTPAHAMFGFGKKLSIQERYPILEKVANGEVMTFENPSGLIPASELQKALP